MRNPKRRNPVHPPAVAVPAAILLAVVVAVATCERLAQPEAAEPEAAKVLDGSALRPMMARLTNSGESELEIVRSDVKDDGGLAANGGSYLCYNVRDCWKKCPASGRDGWSMRCSCKRVWEDDPWPLVCTITEIPDDFFEGGDSGCGGSGDDDGPVDTILADCPLDDIEGFFVTVHCSPGAVRRGDHVTCTAKTYGAEGDILYNWTFVPNGNSKLRGGATYENLPEVTRDSAEEAVWTGRGVHGGTVKVTAVDEEGLQGVGVNNFIVDERGWTTPVSLGKGDSLTNYIGYTPANRKLGMNSDARPKGSSSAFDIMKGQSAVAVVADGPNKGYAYVTSHSYRVDRYWHVNERMMVTGPAEIPDTGQSPVNLWTYLKRRGTDPAVLLRGTLAHETYGQYGGKGHQEQILKVVTPEACGDVAALLEPLVAETRRQAEDRRRQFEDEADTAFVMGVLHNHVYGNHGTGSPIVFWEPGYVPWDTLHVDRYDPSQAYNYTAVGCDWQSF